MLRLELKRRSTCCSKSTKPKIDQTRVLTGKEAGEGSEIRMLWSWQRCALGFGLSNSVS
jgi:hypothetical protein